MWAKTVCSEPQRNYVQQTTTPTSARLFARTRMQQPCSGLHARDEAMRPLCRAFLDLRTPGSERPAISDRVDGIRIVNRYAEMHANGSQAWKRFKRAGVQLNGFLESGLSC
jgi:hypothetical protein